MFQRRLALRRSRNWRHRRSRVSWRPDLPVRWVAADSAYRVGDIERDLRHLGEGCVLGVDSTHVFRSWGKNRLRAGSVAEITKTLEPSDRKRRSAGEGTNGPSLHDWCHLDLADLGGERVNKANQGLWTRGILMRRNIDHARLAYFTVWCPTGTAIETLVNVESHRSSIEDVLQKRSRCCHLPDRAMPHHAGSPRFEARKAGFDACFLRSDMR